MCQQTISTSPDAPGPHDPDGGAVRVAGGRGMWWSYLDLTTFETVAALAPTSFTAVTVTR